MKRSIDLRLVLASDLSPSNFDFAKLAEIHRAIQAKAREVQAVAKGTGK